MNATTPIIPAETLSIAPGVIQFTTDNWHDTAKASAIIAQITGADFRYDFHRNFIRANGERSYLPETTKGFDIHEALSEARSDFIAEQVGFYPDEHTTEAQFNDWIAADRLQATVDEVVAAAIRERGHLGFKPAHYLTDAELASQKGVSSNEPL